MSKKLVFLGSLSVFISGLFYIISDFRKFQLPLLGFGFLCFGLVLLFLRPLRFNWSFSFWFLFRFMSYGVILGTLVNTDPSLFVAGLSLVFSFLILTILTPTFERNDLARIATCAFWIAHIPFLVFPAILQGISLPYRGVFYNPNSLGTVAATVGSVAIATFLGAKNARKYRRVALLCIFVFSVILTLLSMSRTSAVSLFLVVLFLLVAFLIPQLDKSRKRISRKQAKQILLFCVFISLLFLVVKPLNSLLMNTIIKKFLVKAQQGDIFDRRSVLWKIVISEASVFGHGRDYFSHLGLGAHNTYISILGQFGIVVAIPFVGMVTIMLKETFEFARRYYMQDTYALVPLASMTCFVTLSLAEGMLMKSSMFMAFIMARYSFSYRRERDYTE